MTTIHEYAFLAANVYGNSKLVREDRNTLPIPKDWGTLNNIAQINNTSTGFMAHAYKRDNSDEIIIAYAGTTTENWTDWWTGNVPAATAAYFS